ncbi:MAG TPA: GAF domain-containing protein [Bryobacteraceae bacterium]|nr:GAF domain-containing protein [Bryobacteraceae bacterium]
MDSSGGLTADAASQFEGWAAAAFEQSTLAMVRVAPDQKIVACNRTACEMVGLPTLEGQCLPELLADEKNIEIVRRQSDERRKGVSTEYEIEVLHFPDRRRIPIKVTAMPVMMPGGEYGGALAIFRSLERERMSQAFEKAIHAAQGADQIFQAVCEQLQPRLKFDFSAFSVYSKNGRHSRMLFSYDPDRRVESHKRWYVISDALAAWTQRQDVTVIDLVGFVREFPEYQKDRSVQKLLNDGIQWLLRVPVVRGDRVVASFSCGTRDAEGFGEDLIEMLESLPIAKALLMGLHSFENEELSFRFNLIRDMFVCRTPEAIADIATERLGKHYGWESVEVYSIEESGRKIRLLSQWSASPEFRLAEEYYLPMGKGILGSAYESDQDILIGDVTSDPRFKDSYIALRRDTRSELCMPIRVNGRISRILNIEDRRENAFSDEEQEMLRSMLDEIGGLFGAVWDKAVIASSFELTPSIVLIADTAHNVIQHNAAALAQLGFTSQELMNTPIAAYFEKPELADDLFRAPVASVETGLRRKDGTLLPVLVGSRELEGFGAWVFSARDLTHQKRVAELESLRAMYKEIAAQTKTPLSLAFSWIQRVQRKAEHSGSEAAEILQKALVQLKKADLTYERLAFYSDRTAAAAASKEILINAGDLLKRTLGIMPTGVVRFDPTGVPDLYIRSDPFETEFAIESTISYLERFLPADQGVDVSLSSVSERVLIHIQGPFPEQPEGSEETSERVCQTLHEMALGSDIIRTFMQQHGASYRQERLPGGKVRFELSFPQALVRA